ncbi:MAG: hypothetical protein HFF36_02835 [Coprobacillus sp.]|nr:hypothetical protein [Coprobacillus sp.]
MEDKLLEIQVCENYTRDVFITIKVNKENAKELSEILNEFDSGYENYEELIDLLNDKGFEIIKVDDNDSLFSFEDNHYIDFKEVKDDV